MTSVLCITTARLPFDVWNQAFRPPGVHTFFVSGIQEAKEVYTKFLREEFITHPVALTRKFRGYLKNVCDYYQVNLFPESFINARVFTRGYEGWVVLDEDHTVFDSILREKIRKQCVESFNLATAGCATVEDLFD